MKKVVAHIGVLFAVGVASASACSCGPTPPFKEAFARANAVFSGTVEGIRLDGTHRFLNKVTLRVLQSWKGTNADTLVVYTPSHDSMCGYSFVQGRQYLVYAALGGISATNKTDLLTVLCGRNSPLGDTSEDLRSLGVGRKPTVK